MIRNVQELVLKTYIEMNNCFSLSTIVIELNRFSLHIFEQYGKVSGNSDKKYNK